MRADQQPLTKRQHEVFTYVAGFIEAHGYAPSLAEIGEAMNLRSLATVSKHMTNLAEKGYLKRLWNRSRSITVVPPPECCVTCGRPMEQAKVA